MEWREKNVTSVVVKEEKHFRASNPKDPLWPAHEALGNPGSSKRRPIRTSKVKVRERLPPFPGEVWLWCLAVTAMAGEGLRIAWVWWALVFGCGRRGAGRRVGEREERAKEQQGWERRRRMGRELHVPRLSSGSKLGPRVRGFVRAFPAE